MAEPQRKPAYLGLVRLAGPAILTNLLQAAVGLVDVSMVGTLGAAAIAAVTLGNRVFFALQALLIGITGGTTALVARAWGAGNFSEANPWG